MDLGSFRMKLRPTFAYCIRESAMWLLFMLVPGRHTNELICIRPIVKIQALIVFVSSNKQAKHQPNSIKFGEEVAKHVD